MRNREVRVHEKFVYAQTITTTSTAVDLGALNFAGILSNSTNLVNLSDMFRIFKINQFKVRLVWSSSAGLTSWYLPPRLLYILPFDCGAPTSIGDLEADRAVGKLAPYREKVATTNTLCGCSTEAAEPSLKVQHSDLVVIDSASPSGWIATSTDGGQISFGNLYLLTQTAGASAPTAAPGWLLEVEVDVSFRDLVDNNLLSRQRARSQPVKKVLPSLPQEPEIEDLTLSRLKATLKSMSVKTSTAV